jgi:hypothetical protein
LDIYLKQIKRFQNQKYSGKISIYIASWNNNNPERKAIYQNFLSEGHKLARHLSDLFGSIHEAHHCSAINRRN